MSEDMKQDVEREPAADVAEPEAGQKRAQAAAKEPQGRKKAPVEKASFESQSRDGAAAAEREDVNLDVVLDIPVTLSTEIGRTRIPIRSLLQLNQGSVVELDRLAGEPLDVYVNGTLIAHGEVVVVNEKFGIRLTDVISPAERVKKLK